MGILASFGHAIWKTTVFQTWVPKVKKKYQYFKKNIGIHYKVLMFCNTSLGILQQRHLGSKALQNAFKR